MRLLREEAKVQVEKLNKDIKDGEENIKNLLNFEQINSADNAYLDYIFKAESYADFVIDILLLNKL